MTTEEMKQWIDQASYYDLLEKQRNELIGSIWFEGVIGEHFVKVFKQKEAETSHQDQVSASKTIGWEGRND